MDLMELGAIGELLGGIAVVASLVFVGHQVRQTNRLTRAQVRQDSSRLSSELLMDMSEVDLDLLVQACRDPRALSESELRYAGSRFLATANYYETLYYARARGEADDELWQSRLQRMANFFVPARETLWPLWKTTLGESFQRFVETKVFDIRPSESTWAA